MSSLERAVDLYDRLGDRRNWEESSSVLGICHGYQGRFAEGARLFAPAYASARVRADQQSTFWAGQLEAFCRLRLGETETAQARLAELASTVTAMPVSEQINQFSPSALAALRLDDRPGARDLAARALQAVRRPTNAYWIHHSLGMLAETLLSLWETEEDAACRRALRRDAEEVSGALRAFSRSVPISRPASALWSGLHAQLSGDSRRAQRLWQQGLAEAQRRGMAYEEARTHFERGRHATGLQRRRDLWRAVELFEALGARPELQRIRSLG
jgi:hypothetical protein